jgi:hypothetical protein
VRSHGDSESVVMSARGDLSVAAERLLEKVELRPERQSRANIENAS